MELKQNHKKTRKNKREKQNHFQRRYAMNDVRKVEQT